MSGAKFTTTAHATVAATDKIPALKSTTKGYLTPPFFWPPGHLYGMTLSNNGADATNDIDFAAGSCVDSTGVAPMVGSALTKQLDATWAAGTNAGGKMSAAAITNTTYHCFAIRKDSDGSVDYGFDTSPTAPTMPTGYTYFRRIGSIIRASNAIVAFSQVRDRFSIPPQASFAADNSDNSSAITRTLAGIPTGIVVEADLQIGLYDGTPATGRFLLATSLAVTDTAPTSAVYTCSINGDAEAADHPLSSDVRMLVPTNTSAQIRTRTTANDADLYVIANTFGWLDTRGRLA